jgi:hypothetical protein
MNSPELNHRQNPVSARRRLAGSFRLWRPLLLVLALPLLTAGECEQPLVMDSGFSLWCGDTLCAWQVDEGTIAKVPTWHARDYGVDLVAPSTTISQLLPYGSADVSCIHFQLLADIDPSVNVVLDLDFDDGSIHVLQTLSVGAWTPIDYHLVTPTYFQSVRVSIRKSGVGRAVLAQIQAAKSASACPGTPPVGATNRPDGATCEAATQCAGGRCDPRPLAAQLIPDPGTPRDVCAACAGDADCGGGEVCGLGWSAAFFEPFPVCLAPSGLVLGDRCLSDGECATGVCCGGICSSCCAGGPECGSGMVCAERPRDASGAPLRAAFQCAPGASSGAALAPCLGDDDCASAHCAGTIALSVCAADGRRCAAPADCPNPDGNACIALGVADGRCD